VILQGYRSFFTPQINRVMDLTRKLHSARSQLAKLEGLISQGLYPADMQARAPKVQYFVEFLRSLKPRIRLSKPSRTPKSLDVVRTSRQRSPGPKISYRARN